MKKEFNKPQFPYRHTIFFCSLSSCLLRIKKTEVDRFARWHCIVWREWANNKCYWSNLRHRSNCL